MISAAPLPPRTTSRILRARRRRNTSSSVVGRGTKKRFLRDGEERSRRIYSTGLVADSGPPSSRRENSRLTWTRRSRSRSPIEPSRDQLSSARESLISRDTTMKSLLVARSLGWRLVHRVQSQPSVCPAVVLLLRSNAHHRTRPYPAHCCYTPRILLHHIYIFESATNARERQPIDKSCSLRPPPLPSVAIWLVHVVFYDNVRILSRDQDPSWVAGGSRSFRRDSKVGYLKCVRKHRRQKSSIRFSFIKFLPSMLSPSLSQIFIFKMSHAQRYSPRTRKGRLQTRGSRHVPRSVHYRGHSPAARCSCQAGDWDAFQWNGG